MSVRATVCRFQRFGPPTWAVDVFEGEPERYSRISEQLVRGEMRYFVRFESAVAYAHRATHPTPATTGHDTKEKDA